MVVDYEAETEEQRIDRLFRALADATRRDIVRHVLHDEHSVSALADRYPMSFAAVQKHVAVLERAGLITKHRRGRERFVRGRIDAVRAADRLLDEFEAIWRERLERFGDVLADDGRSSSDQPTPENPPTEEGDT